jgi:hypothetical protein
MRLDGTRLDLRTMADRSGEQPLVGGRRYIGVGADLVIISQLADGAEAGIGIGIPDQWVSLHCTPRGYDEHMSPIDRDGWLDVAALTPWREYWLELSRIGGIQVERSDSDGSRYRWYWPLPRDLWRGIQCG